MVPFISAGVFSTKHFETNKFILIGALVARGLSVDAEYSTSPFMGVSITPLGGEALNIESGPGKNVSTTFLGALVHFSGGDQFENDAEYYATIAAFFAPFWENPGKHATVAFLKANKGAVVRIRA